MRVLFIGNSHTYFNDMPETFAKMCRKLTGKRPEVTMIAYSERSLDWHLKEYFAIRYAILYGKFDYCVIQQQAHPFPEPEETWKAVKRITDLCGTRNVMPVLFMTWAEKAHPEVYHDMREVYRDLAEETGAVVAPVGTAFEKIRTGHPNIDLYWKDGAHASVYGSYLTAMILAMTVTGKYDVTFLPDEGIDFECDFEGDNGHPHAIEKPSLAKRPLDPSKTEILRECAGGLFGRNKKAP